MNYFSYFQTFSSSVLIILQLIPILGIFFIVNISYYRTPYIAKISLLTALFGFFVSFLMWIYFDPLICGFQYEYTISNVGILDLGNYGFGFGIDGVNILLILLTTFLTPLCILFSWTIQSYYGLKGPKNLKMQCCLLLCIEFFLIVAFSTKNLLIYFLFFEAVLIPMYLIIGIFGYEPRNLMASVKMLIYTLTGSFPMLASLFALYAECGSLSWEALNNIEFSVNRQIFFWLLMFFSFAVKTPLIPFHNWLPAAHANAPTVGSIILAGVLLKLGTYGFLRWNISIFPLACIYFAPTIFTICLIGIIYISIVTIRQIDIKKLIAYSSIAHMSYCILGLFSLNITGLEGAYLMMIGHGIVSPGLFLCAGILISRFKTRVIAYYGLVARKMPLLSFAFLIFTMGNLSLPLLSPTFIAETLLLTSIFMINKLVAIIAAISMVFTSTYSLFVYCRICFNKPTIYSVINNISDINRREFAVLLPLILLSLFIAVSPSIILDTSRISIAEIVIKYKGLVS